MKEKDRVGWPELRLLVCPRPLQAKPALLARRPLQSTDQNHASPLSTCPLRDLTQSIYVLSVQRRSRGVRKVCFPPWLQIGIVSCMMIATRRNCKRPPVQNTHSTRSSLVRLFQVPSPIKPPPIDWRWGMRGR